MTDAAVEFDGVVAGYGGAPVLRALSLRIAAGEVYALLGPNGSGKSTAARVAAGLLRPDAGDVRWGGRGWSRPVSLAPQEAALFPRLTVRENLAVLAAASGATRGERVRRVDAALSATACVERADQRIETLSGGWRRRANLAGALVCDAGLLVVDEPTEGVDAATRQALSDGLRGAADEGRGCLLISHDAGFVERTADRIGLLRAGRLLVEGPPGRLLEEAFGSSRIVAATLPQPAVGDLLRTLVEDGFEPNAQGLAWRRAAEDPLEVIRRISPVVDAAGGELSVGRPSLDDLAETLEARAA